MCVKLKKTIERFKNNLPT